MSAPASEDLRELERLLVVAAETGEPREFASLREELAIGHDDMQKALDTLREHGKAQEVAPGMWSGPEAGAVSVPPAPVVVSAPEPEPLADLDEGYADAATREAMRFDVAPTVRLTVAIANALDPDALGKLVKAGIEEASAAGETFTLEVVA